MMTSAVTTAPSWRGLKSTPNSASLQPLAKLKSDLRLFEMQITQAMLAHVRVMTWHFHGVVSIN